MFDLSEYLTFEKVILIVVKVSIIALCGLMIMISFVKKRRKNE